MKSIQSQVTKFVEENPSVSLAKTLYNFDNLKPNTIKSAYCRAQKNATIDATNATSKITMDGVEKLIVAGKTPIPLLRVMVDFMKIKQQDHSELEEIDLELFYKKAMEE